MNVLDMKDDEMTITHNQKQVNYHHVSEWIPVSQIPTVDSKGERELIEEHGSAGCYQFARVEDLKEIGSELIHPKIGYIGKSTRLTSRTYDVRAPSGSHGVRRYMNQNDWSNDDVFVRYIHCDVTDVTKLENILHEKTVELTGKTFAWRDASQGGDGHYSMTKEYMKKLDGKELLSLIPYIKELYLIRANEEANARLQEAMGE